MLFGKMSAQEKAENLWEEKLKLEARIRELEEFNHTLRETLEKQVPRITYDNLIVLLREKEQRIAKAKAILELQTWDEHDMQRIAALEALEGK